MGRRFDSALFIGKSQNGAKDSIAIDKASVLRNRSGFDRQRNAVWLIREWGSGLDRNACRFRIGIGEENGAVQRVERQFAVVFVSLRIGTTG